MDRTKQSLILVGCLLALGAAIGGGLMLFVIKTTRDASNDEFTMNQDLADIIRPDVEHFCGSCHGTPSPSMFPKDEWVEEVNQGYDLYRRSGRTDLREPKITEVIAYYEFLAPTHKEYLEQLVEATAAIEESPFTNGGTGWGEVSDESGTSHLNWVRLQPDEEPVLLSCDMRSGTVSAIHVVGDEYRREILATLTNPVHAEVCDLDNDGRQDIVVADLGSIKAVDTLCGSVVWLRATDDEHGYEPIVICEDIGRTCDVRAADFDQDGDLDLVVAEFGWRYAGHLLYLRNDTREDGPADFKKQILDSRHGTVSLAVCDWNGDGLEDFISLVSQEYESIDAFINQGEGQFKIERLFDEPEPSYGSSHLELVDMDGDADLDILYVNGDSFDSYLVKPYHSIQWLERLDDGSVEHHHVANMPGVHDARAGDVDQDGDMDIIAVSLLPRAIEIDRDSVEYGSIILLRNQGDQSFELITLEAGDYAHPTMAMADMNQDGRIDFAVGNVAIASQRDETEPVQIWFNPGE